MMLVGEVADRPQPAVAVAPGCAEGTAGEAMTASPAVPPDVFLHCALLVAAALDLASLNRSKLERCCLLT